MTYIVNTFGYSKTIHKLMSKIPYSIRIDKALLNKVRAQAKTENRSVNNLIEYALYNYKEFITKDNTQPKPQNHNR